MSAGTPLKNMEDCWRSHINLDKRTLVIGPTKSGKTNAIFHISKCMHKQRRINYAMAFSKTEKANGNYGGLDKDDYRLMPCYLTRNYIDTKLLTSYQLFQQRAKRIGEAYASLVIFDDVMCDQSTANKPEVNEVLMNARNFDVGCITGVHGVKQFKPASRDQFRLVVMFKMSKPEAMKAHELFFADAIGDKKEFWRLYKQVIGQGRFWAFGIDLDAEGRENQLFKWKAPRYKSSSLDPMPGVKCPHLGHLEFWLLQRDAYNQAAQETSADVFNVEAIKAKRGVRHGQSKSGDRIILHPEEEPGGDGEILIP